MKSGNTNFIALFIFEDCKVLSLLDSTNFQDILSVSEKKFNINLVEIFRMIDLVNLFVYNESISE